MTKFWVSHSIPYRSTNGGTYRYFQTLQAPIKIHDKFKDIKTIEDVEKTQQFLQELIKSRTGCYFSFDEKELFYRDQQDCVKWYYRENIGVYVNSDTDKVVASSIGEFLSRVYMESKIKEKIRISSFFPRLPTEEELQKLDEDELEYVSFYKNSNDDEDDDNIFNVLKNAIDSGTLIIE